MADYIAIPKDVIDGFVECLAKYEQLLQDAHRRLDLLTKQNEANRMLTIPQACAYLGGITPETLLYYRRMGLDYYKKGQQGIWYRKGDIDDWLASGRVSRRMQAESDASFQPDI